MGFIYRVRCATSGWNGGPGLNTAYFDATGDGATGNQSAAELCVTRVKDAMTAQKTIRPPSVLHTVSPIVDVLQDTDGALVGSLVAATPPTPFAGTGDGAYSPTVVMLLVRLITPSINDSTRVQGHHFLGPLSKFGDSDGTPDAGEIAAGQAYGSSLLDVGIGGGPGLVIWRRPRLARGGPRPLSARAGASFAVTAATVPNKYAVLRSRRD